MNGDKFLFLELKPKFTFVHCCLLLVRLHHLPLPLSRVVCIRDGSCIQMFKIVNSINLVLLLGVGIMLNNTLI